MNVRYLYKDTNELESIPKLVITPCEPPRVVPCIGEVFKSLVSTSVIEMRVLKDISKES